MMKRIVCSVMVLAVVVGCLSACGATGDGRELSGEPLVDATASYTYYSDADGATILAEINTRYADEADEVFMTVNGEEVSKAEYLRAKDSKVFSYQNAIAGIDQTDALTDEQKTELKQQIEVPTEESVANSLVMNMVRRQEVERLGIEVSDADALAWFESAYEAAALTDEGKASYDAMIAASGLSFDAYGIQAGRLNLESERLYETLTAEGVEDYSTYLLDLVDKADVKIME